MRQRIQAREGKPSSEWDKAVTLGFTIRPMIFCHNVRLHSEHQYRCNLRLAPRKQLGAGGPAVNENQRAVDTLRIADHHAEGPAAGQHSAMDRKLRTTYPVPQMPVPSHRARREMSPFRIESA